MTSVIQTQRVGRVALIELNRPDSLNAIDLEARRALAMALDEVARDPDVGAVVLAGAGRFFCAGADLKGGAANPDSTQRRAARALVHDFQPLVESITRIDKPVIAAVNGGAVGFGMSLALACDLMIMAEDAYLLSSFVNVGLLPDGGVAWLLSRRIGFGLTFEALVEAQKLDAPRCMELGVANRVVEPESLRDKALEWATQLAARAPIAVALTKRIIRLSQDSSLSDAMMMEAEMQAVCAATEDAQEAMAAFAEKRPPKFQGR
jgi:2-(1,2-epoxy-1,2-dihydrophenyl)acetyl-CoA isomerase